VSAIILEEIDQASWFAMQRVLAAVVWKTIGGVMVGTGYRRETTVAYVRSGGRFYVGALPCRVDLEEVAKRVCEERRSSLTP